MLFQCAYVWCNNKLFSGKIYACVGYISIYFPGNSVVDIFRSRHETIIVRKALKDTLPEDLFEKNQ